MRYYKKHACTQTIQFQKLGCVITLIHWLGGGNNPLFNYYLQDQGTEFG